MTSGEGEAAGSGTEAHAAAVEAVRLAVVEIRELNAKDGSEEAMKAAKVKLGLAIKAATAAGVSQEELIAASNPPAAEEEALKVGDLVEVYGLESASGRQLNGQSGNIVAFVEEKGRFQIQLGAGSNVLLRPANLRRVPNENEPPAASQEAAADGAPSTAAEADGGEDRPLAPGDRVEVFGLESAGGAKLNGRAGEVVELLDTGRAKVQLSPTEVVSIKPANLRRQRPASPPREPAAEPSGEAPAAAEGDAAKPEKPAEGEGADDGAASDDSSSSSSSSRRPRKRKNNNFGGGGAKARRRELTPEEKLEMLLTGQPPRDSGPEFEYKAPPKVDPADIERDIARAAGAAAAAAAAAAKEPLRPGDQVEVHGLMSAAGRPLNGKQGMIKQFDKAKGRFMVDIGMPSLQSLKPENLRHLVSANSTFENNYSGSTAGYTLL